MRAAALLLRDGGLTDSVLAIAVCQQFVSVSAHRCNMANAIVQVIK